ncbi:ABC transporter, ATP-binding protein [Gottschalkia acidurici 9a]|uniref:ABC transporter, ATP-binding protein n=1 Tax=Gottschalkia acidurici (strain ATCC 7906 / DSM 604 / BCRC 14475 / CIP 104303 / KCTC 5404 / NCIMB 10678 / 9a) TaxID=1128398 RepID=K0AX79_GOTA9|nr:ATP-binding cassette domain-containing protein [Gottschalkia acidurici]AFS77372.1 ABC transporter, ATP-binding protein [Gottschalkia acidurici 9a]
MLKVNNLVKVFNKNTVNENVIFNNFSIEINKGDFITIIGSNGAGKSTLLNVISGVLSMDEGTLILDGKDITNLPEYKRTRQIARVFQDPSKGVSPSMSILENMSMAYNKGKTFGLTRGVSKKNIGLFKELVSTLNLGLENKMDEKVGLLSGGQRQSLSLIMSTMCRPKVLLLDEHTAALDPKTSARIIELTSEIVNRDNITTMMVTHDLSHVTKLGNRVIMMHRGNVVLDIRGEEKKALTVEKLLSSFDDVQGMLSDRTLLSK